MLNVDNPGVQTESTLANTQTEHPSSAVTSGAYNIIKPKLPFITKALGCCTLATLAVINNQPSNLAVLQPETSNLLPQNHTQISNLSGIVVHNAGSDKRSDTLAIFRSQQLATAELLSKYPILGVQLDPHVENDQWVVRHAVSDGSSPLPLVDELEAINQWLDENPKRLLLLDIDVGERIGKGDTSLANEIISKLGDKISTLKDCFTSEGCLNEHDLVEQALANNKRVLFTDRTIEDAQLNSLPVLDQPSISHSASTTAHNYLDLLYRLTLGLEAADEYAFTSETDDRGALPNSGTLAQKLKQPATLLVLDQINDYTFKVPKGLDSEPTLGPLFTESHALQQVALATATALALLSVLQAGHKTAASPKANFEKQAATVAQWAQGVQTLASIFPQAQTALAASTLLPAMVYISARFLTQVANEQNQGNDNATGNPEKLLGIANATTQFASIAKQPISPLLKANAITNIVGAAGASVLSQLKPPEGHDEPSSKKAKVIAGALSSLGLASSVASAGIAFPRTPGMFTASAAAGAGLPPLIFLAQKIQHLRAERAMPQPPNPQGSEPPTHSPA